MSTDAKPEFSKLRSFFWPVHLFELKKVLPMFIIFFCISFNYTVLRDTKDTIVVSLNSSGAESIPFLKVWGVVPCAFLFFVIYSKLSNTLSKENLFYATIVPFLLFFAAFPTFIFPNRDLLHLDTLANFMQTIMPIGAIGFIECIRNWTFSMFYIMSELWGSAVLSLLFWGFANDIMKVSEAKRFYTLLGLGANVALLFSGWAIRFFSQMGQGMEESVRWQMSLNYLMGMVVVLGGVTIATYKWMQLNVLTDPRFYSPEEVGIKKKSKPKMGLVESFKFLGKSKYILGIALLVISYGISINLVEVTWKAQLKKQYTNPNDYSAFMGTFSQITGLVTIVMLFVGGAVIRRFGWGIAASLTPIVLLATGALFFGFIIFTESLEPFAAFMGTTTLFLAVLFGMTQNILSKSTKYSLFDPTKEMAYIPLDQESKVKGKAAIDVVGARLGKSGGSLIQQILLIGFGSMAAITPYIAVILFGIIAAWLSSVKSLNTRFLDLTQDKGKEPLKEAKEPQASTASA